MMKYALLIGDGMADFQVPELGGKTPLEYASTPNMDRIAREGVLGRAQTVPDGMAPGSDVANLALLGYDPARYYSGRAPIEAASLGVSLGPDDTALRCNLVTLQDGVMLDYSAGHVENDDARDIVAELQTALGNQTRRIYTGVSYRHLLVMAGLDPDMLRTVPPHDITGRPWRDHLPSGPGSAALLELMEEARKVLSSSVVNARRRSRGKRPVTDVWLWGQGRGSKLPTIRERFGLTGSVISAVDLVKGLGVLAGLRVRTVEGATGYLGTNYAGKVSAALEALDEEDLVYLHVEAPDETSHEGDVDKKIQAIEEFDRHVVGEMLAVRGRYPSLRLLIAPDHATPVSLKTHHSVAVPYALCGAGIEGGTFNHYSESEARNSRTVTGEELFTLLVRGSAGSDI